MPDFVIKLEFRKPLDQDTLDLAAFRVPMLGVYLAGERQTHEPFYFCREIPGCFRRAAYIDANLFAPSKHVEKISLREKPRQMRPEDNRTYNCRGNGGDQDRSCRHVFRIADEWVKLGRSRVCQEFKSCVESFGCPDNRNSQDEPTPVRWAHSQEEAGGYHKGSGSGMNPGVVLAANHSQNARDCVAEAAEAARKLKRPSFG